MPPKAKQDVMALAAGVTALNALGDEQTAAARTNKAVAKAGAKAGAVIKACVKQKRQEAANNG